MVEHRSPKPTVGGSSPSWPAIFYFVFMVDTAICFCIFGELMKRLFIFYKSAKEELDKVIFPNRDQIRGAFISVVIVVSVVAIFLALIGAIFGAIASSIL